MGMWQGKQGGASGRMGGWCSQGQAGELSSLPTSAQAMGNWIPQLETAWASFLPVKNTQGMVCPAEIRDWEDQLSHSVQLPEANSKTVLSTRYSIVGFFQCNFKSPKWQCFHYFPGETTRQSNIFHCQEVFLEIALKFSLLISFHLLKVICTMLC